PLRWRLVRRGLLRLGGGCCGDRCVAVGPQAVVPVSGCGGRPRVATQIGQRSLGGDVTSLVEGEGGALVGGPRTEQESTEGSSVDVGQEGGHLRGHGGVGSGEQHELWPLFKGLAGVFVCVFVSCLVSGQDLELEQGECVVDRFGHLYRSVLTQVRQALIVIEQGTQILLRNHDGQFRLLLVQGADQEGTSGAVSTWADD